MYLALGDVGALVRLKREDPLANLNGGLTAHDHPVLGAMLMLLQTQACAGPHQNALNLKPLVFVDAVIPAPWPVHLTMNFSLGPTLLV